MRAVRYWVSSIILAAGSVAVVPQAMAQQEATTPDSVPSLQSRVDELDQQVRVLQRLRELAADSAAAAAKDKVSATASGKDGFSIKSADGKFSLKFRGLVQTDGAVLPVGQRLSRDQQLLPPPGAADPRGDRRQVSRVPAPARLRPGHDRAVRRLLRT